MDEVGGAHPLELLGRVPEGGRRSSVAPRQPPGGVEDSEELGGHVEEHGDVVVGDVPGGSLQARGRGQRGGSAVVASLLAQPRPSSLRAATSQASPSLSYRQAGMSR